MDLTVFIQNDGQALAPLVTNNRTNVVYKNPFGFSLTAIQAGGDFIMFVDLFTYFIFCSKTKAEIVTQ